MHGDLNEKDNDTLPIGDGNASALNWGRFIVKMVDSFPLLLLLATHVANTHKSSWGRGAQKNLTRVC